MLSAESATTATGASAESGKGAGLSTAGETGVGLGSADPDETGGAAGSSIKTVTAASRSEAASIPTDTAEIESNFMNLPPALRVVTLIALLRIINVAIVPVKQALLMTP